MTEGQRYAARPSTTGLRRPAAHHRVGASSTTAEAEDRQVGGRIDRRVAEVPDGGHWGDRIGVNGDDRRPDGGAPCHDGAGGTVHQAAGSTRDGRPAVAGRTGRLGGRNNARRWSGRRARGTVAAACATGIAIAVGTVLGAAPAQAATTAQAAGVLDAAGPAHTARPVRAVRAAALVQTARPTELSRLAQAAGPAQAAQAGYRYWSFWEHHGRGWAYATEGPATARPADGDVHGFRFSVGEDSQNAAKPRGTARFDAICAGTKPRPGTKRVGLVIDFGTAADAPPAAGRAGETPPKPRTECARVPEDATTADALAAVAKPLRYNSAALLCAIFGYPKTGCADEIPGDGSAPAAKTDASAQRKRTAQDGGPSAGLLAGLAVVIGLGTAALWQTRRRRR